MSELRMNDLLGAVIECMELQNRASKDWHWGDPVYESELPDEVEGLAGLRELAMRQHWVVFRLYHAEEDDLGIRKREILREKGDELDRRIDEHMNALISCAGFEPCSIGFGQALRALSELGLQAYHLREEGKQVSHEASHSPKDARLQRAAEKVLERVGEVDTRRMYLGRELLDALNACAPAQND